MLAIIGALAAATVWSPRALAVESAYGGAPSIAAALESPESPPVPPEMLLEAARVEQQRAVPRDELVADILAALRESAAPQSDPQKVAAAKQELAPATNPDGENSRKDSSTKEEAEPLFVVPQVADSGGASAPASTGSKSQDADAVVDSEEDDEAPIVLDEELLDRLLDDLPETSRETATVEAPEAEHKPAEIAENDAAKTENEQLDSQRDDPPPVLTSVEFAGLSGELPRQLDGELLQVRREIGEVVNYYHRRTPDVRDHNPWEVMHWIIGYGAHGKVRVPSRRGAATYGAISWLANNGPCAGETMLHVERGLPVARKGPRVQGHYGQYLAILAQTGVPRRFPIRIRGEQFVIDDLVESEKLSCEADTELTFKLIALSHYLDSDAKWKSRDGQSWSIERLISEEISQPINGVACGGTHRLMGLSYAVRRRLEEGREISGEFERAYRYVRDYHEYAFALQNRDGSFSTEWLKQRAYRVDPDRWIQTTGHILEWLAYSLPDEELTSPRMVRSVGFLARTLNSQRSREWEIGPLGHALRALRVYDQRVFDRYDNSGRFDPEASPEPAELVDHRFDANMLAAVAAAGRQREEHPPREEESTSRGGGGLFNGLFGR